jgi:hypothetical protein
MSRDLLPLGAGLLISADCVATTPSPPTNPGPPPVEWSADLQTIADSSSRFALDLYRQLKEKPGNASFPRTA